ncbi:response regulator transcription factor [Metabacillus sp. HB246100]
MENKTILVVDDEQDMRQLIRLYLQKDGYSVIEAADGDTAHTLLENQTPHLILLDVMMPIKDGFTVAKEIHSKKNIPIIFLTARGDETDRIYGLKLGADDYVVKPFSPGELLARVAAVLRRVSQEPSIDQEDDPNVFGPLHFNLKARKVSCDGQSLTLTLKEYELLYFLAMHRDQVFSREHLLQKIWGVDYLGSERTVDTHIKTLRIKLMDSSSLIQTVWGVGYKFDIS